MIAGKKKNLLLLQLAYKILFIYFYFPYDRLDKEFIPKHSEISSSPFQKSSKTKFKNYLFIDKKIRTNMKINGTQNGTQNTIKRAPGMKKSKRKGLFYQF